MSAAGSSVPGMGRIIFDSATTLNGWIADEAHSLDWLFSVEGGDEPAEGLYPSQAAVLVEGSTTYEWVLEHEKLMEFPERWAELYGEKPTFVFSSRELPIPEGADVRVVSGPVAETLPAIRAAAGDGDMWVVGGGELAGRFLDIGALDGVAVSIAPVVLAAGAPLLPRRLESDRLHLASVRQVGQFARLVYEVRAE